MHLFIFDQICFKFGTHHYWMMTFIQDYDSFFFLGTLVNGIWPIKKKLSIFREKINKKHNNFKREAHIKKAIIV